MSSKGALAALTVLFALAACTGDTLDARSTTGWVPLPNAPGPPRTGTTSVWTGDEVLFWGGLKSKNGRESTGRPTRDGVAYNPKTRSWSEMPDAPVALNSVGTVTGWTGSEMVVFGDSPHPADPAPGRVPQPAGAAYNPKTRAWRRLPANPLTPRSGYLGGWTQGRLLVLGADDTHVVESSSYDPRTNKWQVLPDVPFTDMAKAPPRRRPIQDVRVFTDDEAAFVFGELELIRFAPGSGWTKLPNYPSHRRVRPAVAYASETVLIVGGSNIDVATDALPESRSGVLLLTWSGEWGQIPTVPDAVQLHTPVVVRDLVVFPHSSGVRELSTNDLPPGAAFDMRGNWYATPGLPEVILGATVATDDAVLVWGNLQRDDGRTEAANKGYELRLPKKRPKR